MPPNKKKHILFLTYHLPMPNEPGAFRPWMEARLMARAGFFVTVITSGVQYMTGKNIRHGKGWCTEEFQDGIRILRTWAPSDHRRSLFRRILNYLSYTILAGFASLLKTGKVDRIFAGTDPIFIMPMVYLVSRIKRAGLILDERDLFPETAIALGVMKEGILSRFFLYMQQFYRHESVAIFSATPGIRFRLIDYGHSRDKIYLLYNADVFIEEDLKNDTTKFSLRGQTGKTFFAGYAGGLGKANDIPTLLRAAAHLLEIDDIGIVVVGSGERQKDYKDYCAKHGLTNVFFFDAVPRHEVRQLLRQFDICVQPLPKNKHFFSTLTSKTFDYHGVGKSMVFCGSGDTEILLAESGGGITVTSGDDKGLANAICDLYQNEKKRYIMGQSAKKWFDKYINAQVSCDILHRVINNGSIPSK